ncbi:hypothetical protein PO909_012544 [Leuciscus waleckii]
MKLLGRSWYVPFYEPLSCISLCWREHCRFCPLPELDALPSSSPDRSHNGKTPPAVSLLLWDTERSGIDVPGTLGNSWGMRMGSFSSVLAGTSRGGFNFCGSLEEMDSVVKVLMSRIPRPTHRTS